MLILDDLSLSLGAKPRIVYLILARNLESLKMHALKKFVAVEYIKHDAFPLFSPYP